MDDRLPPVPRVVDVLVVGSGAAGLTAALTAAVSGRSVLLIEAADRFGGTSALSGGRVWIPSAEGSDDDEDSAIEYLTAVFGSQSVPMIEAFVHGANPMARFVELHSRHRFVPCPSYPDYHPELRGATAGGRAHDVAPIAGAELVAEASEIHLPPGYLPITHAEWETWRFPQHFDWDLLEQRQENRTLTNGAGLVAALIDGCVRAGALLLKRMALLDAEQPTSAEPIRAHIGGARGDATVVAGALVLASGGFDANPHLRTTLLPPGLAVSASVPTNTGIALQLAREREHAVENLAEGWWMPTVQLPDDTVAGKPFPRSLVRERGVPHQIAVNRAGQRFVDEACPYHEFVKAMLRTEDDGRPNGEAWLIFDEQFRSKYPFPGLTKTGPTPDHLTTSASIGELANLLGINSEALMVSVDRWNGHCRAGYDADFGRGENIYDRYYGDPGLSTSPNLGTIERSPFYAARILSGTVGSKGGPVTTPDGHVVGTDGQSLPRWYAAGNAAASWTSDGYPGPGTTLGIAMTFAHRAALSAVRIPREHG